MKDHRKAAWRTRPIPGHVAEPNSAGRHRARAGARGRRRTSVRRSRRPARAVPGSADGSSARAPLQVERIQDGSRSSAARPVRGRHRVPSSAGADGGIHRHNTPSSRLNTVCVYYRFHPLSGGEFEVFTASRSSDRVVTIKDPLGRRLKIPSWMTKPDAAHMALRSEATVAPQALSSLAELLQPYIEDSLVSAVIPETEGCSEAARVTSSKPARKRRSRDSSRIKGTPRTIGLHDHSDCDRVLGSSGERNSE